MHDMWTETNLGKQTRLVKGVTYASADYCSKEDGHVFLTIKCVKKGGGFSDEGLKFYRGSFAPEQVLRRGDLVIALTDLTRAGDIVGGPLVVPDFGEGATVLPSMDLAILRPAHPEANLEFVFFRLMLEDARRYMLAHAGGTTVLHLESRAVPKFRFKIPDPERQSKIVEILTTVDEAINHTEALIAKTQQIKSGMMHDLFTRGVTADGKLRPLREDAPQSYKETPIGWIPKEWQVVSIQELTSRLISGAAIKTDEFADEGVAVIAKGDVTSNKLVDIETRKQFVPRNVVALKYARSLIEGSHIVVSLRDLVPSAPTVGMASLMSGDGEYLLAQGAYGLVIRDEVLSSNLFVEYTRGTRFRALMKTKAVGSTQVHVRSSEYLKVLVPRPCGDEQTKMLQKLLALDSLSSSLAIDLFKLTQTKAGLMHDLLTGRVKVSTR